jgi:hypothetical protein
MRSCCQSSTPRPLANFFADSIACIVVGAIKLHRHDKMVIAANDVNQIIGHMRQPVAGSHTDYAFIRIALSLPGSGLKNQKSPARPN